MVPITTKTHVKQGGGLLKTLQIPYNQNHLSQLRRVSTRFPTVSSLPKTQRAPGGDSWEQLPPFVPNNLGLSSPLNICKRHPNKFHYLPAVLECHVCFRDVGWGGCCFDIQVWGWLKRIVFLGTTFIFGAWTIFGPWKSLWRIYMFWRDPHWTCCYTFGSGWLRWLHFGSCREIVIPPLPQNALKHVSSAHASECDQHGECSQLLCHGNCESSDRFSRRLSLNRSWYQFDICLHLHKQASENQR